jgi:hypothetical protein
MTQQRLYLVCNAWSISSSDLPHSVCQCLPCGISLYEYTIYLFLVLFIGYFLFWIMTDRAIMIILTHIFFLANITTCFLVGSELCVCVKY